MRDPEQRGNDHRGAAHGKADVVLHAGGNLGDKRRPPGVTNSHAVGGRRRGGHDLLDRIEPVGALAVIRQIAAGLDEENAELAVRRGENLLAVAETRSGSGHTFG